MSLPKSRAVPGSASFDHTPLPPCDGVPGGTGHILLNPSTSQLAVGASVTIVATNEFGHTIPNCALEWSNNNPYHASVTPEGIVHGLAVGGPVTITARTTTGTPLSGTASILVANTGSTPVDGTVSIASVSFTDGAGQQQPAPVPPGAVGTAAGIRLVNVAMTLNIGTTTADSIVLRISGQAAFRQVFTAAQAAALRATASVNDAGQPSGTVTITGSLNVADYCSPAPPPVGVGPGGTCQFLTNPPTTMLLATARWQNGNQSFQVFYYGKQTPAGGGSPVNTGSSSAVLTYRFANLDGWHLAMTITPVFELPAPTGSPGAFQNTSAVDLAGFTWRGGTMGITAWFVQYTPGVQPIATPGLVNVTYNNFGCSATGGLKVAPLTKVQAVNAALTAGPWTATLNGPLAQGASTVATGTSLATNLVGYEFSPAICPGAIFTSGGEMPSITAVGTDNNNIPTLAAGFNGGAGVINTFANSGNSEQGIVARIDNVAPPAPTFSQEAGGSNAATCSVAPGALVNTFGGRTNCWFNDAVVLNGLATGFNTGSAVGTSTVAGTTANGIVFSGTDVGSGRQVGGAILTTFTARADLATVAAVAVDGNAAITSPAGLAEDGVNNLYQLRVRSADPINNTRNTAAGAFGVDRTPPQMNQIGNDRGFFDVPGVRSQAYAVTTNIFAVADPLGIGSSGPVLGSGFFSASLTPLTLSQAQRTATGTVFWCPSAALGTGGYQSSGTTCANTAVAPANNGWISGTNFRSNFIVPDVRPNAACANNPLSICDAYYTGTLTVADQAGNVGPVFAEFELLDGTASSLGGLSYTPSSFVAGGPASFAASITDNLDVQGAGLNLTYGASGGAAGFGTPPFGFVPTSAAGGATFWYNSYNIVVPNQAGPACPSGNGGLAPGVFQLPFCDFRINTWPTEFTAPAALIQSTSFSATLPNMVTNIQVPLGADGGLRVLTSSNNLQGASSFAYNQACTMFNSRAQITCTPGSALTEIPSSAIPAQTLIDGTGGASPTGGPIRWNICAVREPSFGSGGVCPATIPNPSLAADVVSMCRDPFCDGIDPILGLPLKLAITAVASGLTASGGGPNFANPFAQVQFWAYNPTASPAMPAYQTEGWRLIGTVSAPNGSTDAGLECTPSGPCGGRNWSFGIVWDPQPGTAPNTAANPVVVDYQIMAVGIMNSTSQPLAAGMALATPVAPVRIRMR
jgi:hypothetical protein